MNTNEIFAIGLMSGTSLDGVDLVYVRFDKKEYKDFKILHSETIPYTTTWKQVLQNAIGYSKDELKKLDASYGTFLGGIINSFIDKFKIENINFIASHGHTILHEPQNGITLQVGSGAKIAKITNIKVVCDFRTQDVQMGGQGAPLVPIGDAFLFADYDYCVNLGGFANVSFKENDKRIAFDICPVNIVLNFYANKIGLEYDNAGKIASQGKINATLLEKLNSLEFYQKKPPKSLGLEWVQKEIFPLINEFEIENSSILRTLVAHSAIQISKIISNSNSVLITGGGVYNSFLIQQIEKYSNTKIKIKNDEIINYKEALIFAFLGLLRVDSQVNCLKSVTGASKDHSSGVVFMP